MDCDGPGDFILFFLHLPVQTTNAAITIAIMKSSESNRISTFLTGFSLFLLSLCRIQLVTAASTISTFSDENCEESSKSLDGPNGYPDGSCSTLSRSGKFSSFQIDQLDPGCAVTIYGLNSENGSPCSSTTTIVTELTRCYNSSWIYYSIDGCIKPPGTASLPSTSSSTPSSTSTSTSTSSPSSSASETASSPPSSSSAFSAEPQTSSPNYSGAIAGGIVGGFALLATVIALIWFFWYRRRRLLHGQAPNDTFLRGMPGLYAGKSPQSDSSQFDSQKLSAVGFREIRPARELSGKTELGPAELEGGEGGGSGASISPITQDTAR